MRAAGLRARWLVAADGLHSPLRRSLGLDLPARGVRRYGQRRHYRMTPWTDFVEVHWSGGGEAYVTPVGHDLVGVAILSSGRRGFEEHLSAFPGLVERLRGPAVTPVRGAGPLRQHVRARRSGRVLLVGDAAGYVDALTGEGISLAVRSAEILTRCLREDRPQDYEGAWLRLSRTPPAAHGRTGTGRPPSRHGPPGGPRGPRPPPPVHLHRPDAGLAEVAGKRPGRGRREAGLAEDSVARKPA